jgi:hypothetical protein
LSHAHAGSSGQPPIGFGHNGGEAFLARQHTAHFLAVIVERTVNRDGAPARHSKYEIDARLFEHARDRLWDRYFFVN